MKYLVERRFNNNYLRMKRNIFILLCLAGVAVSSGCKEQRPGYFEGSDYIRFYTTGSNSTSGDYTASPSVSPPSISMVNPEATYLFKLQVVGDVVDRPRRFFIETYEDETQTQAVPVTGVNYVPFDDERIVQELVVPANANTVEFPVIVKFDFDTHGNSNFRLAFRLVEKDGGDFKVISSHCKAALTFSQYNP